MTMTPADFDQTRATITAALRTYQAAGYGDPANRPDEIHDIATAGGDVISLDDDGINELCEMLTFGLINFTESTDEFDLEPADVPATGAESPFTVIEQDELNRFQVRVTGLGDILFNRTTEGLIIDVVGSDTGDRILASLGMEDGDFHDSYDDEPIQSLSTRMVPVTINTFDDEGNQVDTDTMELADHQVSDVVDHASQLVVVMRDIARNGKGIEAFDQVYSELESAIVTAGIVNEDAHPLPTLHLSSLQSPRTEGKSELRRKAEELLSDVIAREESESSTLAISFTNTGN